jgi:hypothetical protein
VADAERCFRENFIKLGYFHNECLWRHIGVCELDSKRVILFDLGNVSVLGNSENAESKLNEVIDKLKADSCGVDSSGRSTSGESRKKQRT